MVAVKVYLLFVAGDECVAYANHPEDGAELPVRYRQALFIESLFAAPQFEVHSSFHRFTNVGVEGIESVQRMSDAHLFVVFLCHGNVNTGHPAAAQTVSQNPAIAADVVIRSVASLRRTGDWASHSIISSQCYGGLDFRERILAQVDGGWKVWCASIDATLVEPIYIQREALRAMLNWFIPANRVAAAFWTPGTGPAYSSQPTVYDVEVVTGMPLGACCTVIPVTYRNLAVHSIDVSIHRLGQHSGAFYLPATGPAAEIKVQWRLGDDDGSADGNVSGDSG